MTIDKKFEENKVDEDKPVLACDAMLHYRGRLSMVIRGIRVDAITVGPDGAYLENNETGERAKLTDIGNFHYGIPVPEGYTSGQNPLLDIIELTKTELTKLAKIP